MCEQQDGCSWKVVHGQALEPSSELSSASMAGVHGQIPNSVSRSGVTAGGRGLTNGRYRSPASMSCACAPLTQLETNSRSTPTKLGMLAATASTRSSAYL